MTTEEAIKELRDASDNEVRYGDTEHHYNEVMKRIEAFDMAIKALEQQQRDCNTCKHSDNGNCAYTEECHECMWKSKYEQQPCDDCISRKATVERLCKVAEFMNEKREGLGSPYVMAALLIQDNKDEFPSVTPTISEKETVEDCINRQAVDEYITNLLSGYLYDEERTRLEDLTAYIWELPLVQPTGKWIVCDVAKFGDFVETERYECSKCHHRVGAFKRNFCPNCGARMAEGEET